MLVSAAPDILKPAVWLIQVAAHLDRSVQHARKTRTASEGGASSFVRLTRTGERKRERRGRADGESLSNALSASADDCKCNPGYF
eukprot:589723-Hanusia_phi.AAC.1